MIVGTCPYEECSEPFMIEIPNRRLPVMLPHECEGCEQKIWTMFSRIDPKSWTVDAFAEEYTVDEKIKQVKERAEVSK